MTDETLRCRCGREVRLVRLNARTLRLGHVTNPGPLSHPVRLARTTADASTHAALGRAANGGREDIQPSSEVSDLVRGRETPGARGASRPRTTQPRSRSGQPSADPSSPHGGTGLPLTPQRSDRHARRESRLPVAAGRPDNEAPSRT